jgi:glutamyl-tRNA synthetase
VSVVEKSGDLNNLKPLVEALVKEKEWGFGKVLGMFRLSIVGELSGPDLFEVVSIIGKQETLERLHTLKDHLNKSQFIKTSLSAGFYLSRKFSIL